MRAMYANNKPVLAKPTQYVPEETDDYSTGCEVVRAMEHEFEGGQEKDYEGGCEAGREIRQESGFEAETICGFPKYTREQVRPVKQFLYGVWNLKREIEYLERQIGLWEDAAEACEDQDEANAKYQEIDRLREQVKRKEAESREVAIAVAGLAGKLTDARQKTIILKRYVDMQAWDRIALDMGIGIRKAHRLHGWAIVALRGIMDGEQH